MTAAEVACAAAGWELATSAVAKASEPGEVAVWARASGFDVVVLADGDVEPTRLDFQGVDLPTLELAAVLAARGVQPLDVGPCPECALRLRGLSDAQARALAMLPVEVGSYGAPQRKTLGSLIRRGLAEEVGEYPTDVRARPCPACTIDGKPSGRHVVAIEVAVFMAAPRTLEFVGDASAANIWEDEQEAAGATVTWGAVDGDDYTVFSAHPGHKGASEALRALGLSWTTLLYDFNYGDLRAEVLGDFVEANALPVDWSPLSAEGLPCPALPTWVGAWLGGACGDGGCLEYLDASGAPAPLTTCRPCTGKITPHLAAIEADLEQLWERASVECPIGCDGGEIHMRLPGSMHTAPCDHCGGLGRVRSGEMGGDNACALVAPS